MTHGATMEVAFDQLPRLVTALWWPFCRMLAMLSSSPILGESMVPVTPRVLLALVMAVVMMPLAQPMMPIDPFSLQALVVTLEEGLIGFCIGLAFHLVMAVSGVFGFMTSSQLGLSMGIMNDPMNGNSADIVSAILSLLFIMLFFAIDGHLVLAGVVGASFHAWPVGGAFDLLTLKSLAFDVSWIFSASLLLAVPVIFSAMVVQIGFGFLNRAAPALNLHSLGFSVVTVFGLYMLVHVVRFIPEHYVRLTNHVLDQLQQGMR
jgi:flagellar biosynthetic protein FliR